MTRNCIKLSIVDEYQGDALFYICILKNNFCDIVSGRGQKKDIVIERY